MKDLHYVDLSTSQEYKFQNNKEDLMTSTDNSFGTESVSSTSAPQNGGFFWGANGGNKNDENCLIAARTKNYEVVDFMLNHDMLSELTAQDEEGNTLLHYLARDFSVNSKVNAIISSLLKRNNVSQFINIQDKNGDTPLIAAVRAGNMSLSEQLISNGANKQIKNNDGLYVGSESEKGTNTRSSSRVTSEKELTESINDMVNMFVKMGRPVVIDTESPYIINTESANMPDHLSITESIKSYADTSDNASSFSIKDTDTFLNMLEHKYIKGTQKGGAYQKGVKQVRIGNRNLRYYGHEGSYEGTASDAELSRMIDNQASDIHKRVVEKIMDILKIEENIARNYKAAIYKEVRDEQPNLAGLDRAVEMEKRVTKDKLKSIDIKKVTKEIEQHLKEKNKERAERDNNTDNKKSVTKKDDKKSAKKSTKKVKTESEGISETSVGSPNNGILSETSLSDSSFDDEE